MPRTTPPTTVAIDATLNPQQRRFVAEYLIDLNASAAYLRAGYKVTTLESAQAAASRLLSDHRVATAVAQRQAQIDHNLGVTAERIERQSARIAFADIRDVMTIAADGEMTIKPSEEWTDAAVAAVASVTVTEFKGKRTVTVKMRDSLAALEQLYKRQNLYRGHEAASGEGQADAFAAGLLAARRLLATAHDVSPQLPAPTTIEGEATPAP